MRPGLALGGLGLVGRQLTAGELLMEVQADSAVGGRPMGWAAREGVLGGVSGSSDQKGQGFQGRMSLALLRDRVGPQLPSREIVLPSAWLGHCGQEAQPEAWSGQRSHCWPTSPSPRGWALWT